MSTPTVFEELREALTQREIDVPAVGIDLALVLHHRTCHRDAMAVIDQVIERSPQPAQTVLKGISVAALGQAYAAPRAPPGRPSRVVDSSQHTPWSLGLLASRARKLRQPELATKYRAASTAATEAEDSPAQGAQLPEREQTTIRSAR